MTTFTTQHACEVCGSMEHVENYHWKKRGKTIRLSLKHRLQFLYLAITIKYSAVTFDVANDTIIFHRKVKQ